MVESHLNFQARLQTTATFAKPTFGTMAGGGKIQVFGTNFRPIDNLVSRFGEQITTALFIGQNVLECITPAHDVLEVVKVAIVSESGGIAFVENGFEYLMSFQVSSIRPDNGLAKGGALVTIAGSGFTQARASIYCYFDNSSVAATVDSDHNWLAPQPHFKEAHMERWIF
jgi:hypothetical protein